MVLTCKVRKDPEVSTRVIVMLKGEINSETSAKLSEALESATSQGVTDVIVNLSEVSYISSAGWRVFIRCTRLHSARLSLTGMRSTVRDVYELLGMARVIGAHDSVQTTFKAIESSSNQEPVGDSVGVREDVNQQVSRFIELVKEAFDPSQYSGDDDGKFDSKVKRIDVALRCLKLTFHDYLLTKLANEISLESDVTGAGQ